MDRQTPKRLTAPIKKTRPCRGAPSPSEANLMADVNGTSTPYPLQHTNGHTNGYSVFTDTVEDVGLYIHDVDSEQAVIGALLLEGETFGQVNRMLTPASFYSERLRLIWKAIAAVWDEGSPVNTVSVAYMLQEQEQLGML